MAEQDRLWRQEGTSWYERNKAALAFDAAHPDPMLTLLARNPIQPTSILDVGASTGWRADYLAKFYRCGAIAVDVSAEAVAEGRRLYRSRITVQQGTATNLDVPDQTVDLVVVSFLLHCLARVSVFLAVSEIDRVLAPGGYLVLADFSPDVASKRPWRHREGIWTYKLPDAGAWLFRASETYRYVDSVTFDHDTHEIKDNVPSARRAKAVLLQKADCYQEESV